MAKVEWNGTSWGYRYQRGLYRDRAKKEFGFKDKHAAEKAQARFIAALDENPEPAVSSQRLEPAFNNFLKDGKRQEHGKSRLQALWYTFDRFIIPYFGANILLADIRAKPDPTIPSIEGFIAQQRKRTPPVSKNTIRHYVMDLSSLFNWCIQQEPPLLASNPVKRAKMDALKGWKIKKPPLDLKLVERCAELLFGRDKAWYDFARLTGYRMSEANRLEWPRLNLDEGWQFVPGTKTDGSEDTLPLAPVVVEFLREWKKQSDPNCRWVFPSPRGEMQVKCEGIFERIRLATGGTKIGYHRTTKSGKLQKEYKVVGGTHLSAKVLRDYFATVMIKKTDLKTTSELLRHSNTQTTSAYLRTVDERLVKAVEGLRK